MPASEKGAGGTPAVPGHRGWHARGYLPHFDSAQAVQLVTFRLADSLPRHVWAELVGHPGIRSRVETMLDEGRGECLLAAPEHARSVANALRHFDGERYGLLAWVIMPNHVHALVEQIEGYRLGDVVASWKSFTAKAINRERRTSGAVWAPDYHDRYIRDERHFGTAVRYVEENPVKAGLVRQAEDWEFSSAARDRGHPARF